MKASLAWVSDRSERGQLPAFACSFSLRTRASRCMVIIVPQPLLAACKATAPTPGGEEHAQELTDLEGQGGGLAGYLGRAAGCGHQTCEGRGAASA